MVRFSSFFFSHLIVVKIILTFLLVAIIVLGMMVVRRGESYGVGLVDERGTNISVFSANLQAVTLSKK
jgi:hypothetical protein